MLLQRVGPNLLFVGSYLHLARIFAKGGSRARKFRWKLKFLRMKRGGLFDSASWTVRFSKVIKMWVFAVATTRTIGFVCSSWMGWCLSFQVFGWCLSFQVFWSSNELQWQELSRCALSIWFVRSFFLMSPVVCHVHCTRVYGAGRLKKIASFPWISHVCILLPRCEASSLHLSTKLIFELLLDGA